LTPSPVHDRVSLVSGELERAPSLAFLLDYDGTLVGFTLRPEEATPDAELIELLRAIAAKHETHVVSGRPKDVLESWFGALRLGLHAEHGLWSRAPGDTVWFRSTPVVRPDALPERVAAAIAKRDGIFIETKTAGVAVHYRGAKLDDVTIDEVERDLVAIAEPFDYEVLRGHRVLELRPKGVHKGLVAHRVAARLPAACVIVAIGDDRTDEDLFDALPPNGLAIAVGDRPSRARFRLAGPPDVRRLLRAAAG
jgi:trehalose 6-phosphate synthase/phosphatase